MMNEGVEINCKAFMTQVFTVHLVELGTAIEKSKGYIEASTFIKEPHVTLPRTVLPPKFLLKKCTSVSLIRCT